MTFQDLSGAVIATSVYASGTQIAGNIPVKLPEITPKLVEITAAGGTLEIPVWQLIDAMESSISKTGLDKSYAQVITPEAFDLIINIVQQSVSADGTTTPQHIKAYQRVIPKSAPGLELTPGESGENEITFSVLSYQLYLDGSKVLDIDVPKGICFVGGKDYSEGVRNML